MSVVANTERTRAHDHVVGFYLRDEELTAAVTAFVIDALDAGGAAVVIATEAHRAALDEALGRHGHRLEDLTRDGRFRSFDAGVTLARFMRDGRPDPRAFSATIEPILAEVAGAGSPVHAFGEMVALLWDAGNVTAAIELEAMWNDLAAVHDFALLCAYDITSVERADDLGAAQRICEEHSNVIALHDPIAPTPESATTGPGAMFERLFLATPSAPIRVRAFVRETLRLWGDEALFGVAGVIAAELATNAMVHAQSPFRVTLTRSDRAILIAVRDTSPDKPEQLGRDHRRTGGRGIAIVAALSRAWGTEHDPGGKIVWAEISRDPIAATG